MTTTETTTTVPDNVPAKFRDPKTGAVRLDSLVNSYLELEKKLSSAPPAPQRPDSPDAYDVDVSHGLFTVDPVVNQRLFDLGCSNDQTQAVYDLAAQKLVPALVELAQDYQAQRETDRLTDAFGGPEAWTEMSRQLLAYGQQNLPQPVLNNLSGTYEGVMALHNMMSGGQPAVPGGPAPATAPPGEADVRAMMRDPRYWRQKDPAYIAKVTEGFQKIYG